MPKNSYGLVNSGGFYKDQEQDSGAHTALSAEAGLLRQLQHCQSWIAEESVQQQAERRATQGRREMSMGTLGE